jgi:predicted  nucleic acid-binding Zn-ribbon protein
VVNDDGRVLRVVPPQLSAEEIVIRDRELEREAELEAERQSALQHDNELMQLYATPEEVGFARNRKVESIDEAINALKRDIQQLRNKQRLYETQAAEKERGLMPVSREILTNLETVKHQIAKAQREIEARREERERVQVEFGRDLNRIYELYGLPPQPIAAT